jgi:hypothetical protein
MQSVPRESGSAAPFRGGHKGRRDGYAVDNLAERTVSSVSLTIICGGVYPERSRMGRIDAAARRGCPTRLLGQTSCNRPAMDSMWQFIHDTPLDIPPSDDTASSGLFDGAHQDEDFCGLAADDNR